MFCEEPIKAIYASTWDGTYEEFLESEEKPYADGDVCFFCYYPEPLCCIEPPSRLILETDSCYLQVDPSGVVTIKKAGPIATLERPNERLRSFSDEQSSEESGPFFDDYPCTLLVGERLQRVYREEYYLMLQFDDFILQVLRSPVENYCSHQAAQRNLLYYQIHGCERLLNHRCACGGEPEILKDYTGDYLIRCKACKQATSASMTVQEAIDNWNQQQKSGKPDLHPLSLPFDDLAQTFGDRILSFAVNKETAWWLFPSSCDCRDILIQTEKQEILLEQAHKGEEDVIYFGNPHIIDRDQFTWKVLPEANAPIVFDKALYTESGLLEGLRFRFGETYLFIFGGEHELIMTRGTDPYDYFEPWIDDQEDILFNETGPN